MLLEKVTKTCSITHINLQHPRGVQKKLTEYANKCILYIKVVILCIL